ncbi:substrate-binding domain-containing protein [Terasakiella pusilla]|uniref:substrate-binding domain-containing protein n=1 Tax=Terasakiella pusilla TaxID=64973 RepID=UPI003AA93AC2
MVLPNVLKYFPVRLGAWMMIANFCVIGASFGDVKIAVIGKTKNDSFYEQAFQGCQALAKKKSDVTCLYDGPTDYQDVRSQVNVVQQMLETDVDALLISTTESKALVERALKLAQYRGIPVVTFDSDLEEEDQSYRLAYVGTNNFDFGVALGRYAQRFKTDGINNICIQSGSQRTPNLNERIKGVRFALSGNRSNKKLEGENGWREHHRCPFYTLGKRDRALSQLEFILAQPERSVFLAVAGFAQFSPDYIETIIPYQNRIEANNVVIISADAEEIQLKALELKLSTVNIGQRPFEMGRVGASLLYDYLVHNKKPDKEINFLGFYYCHEDRGVQCSFD